MVPYWTQIFDPKKRALKRHNLPSKIMKLESMELKVFSIVVGLLFLLFFHAKNFQFWTETVQHKNFHKTSKYM